MRLPEDCGCDEMSLDAEESRADKESDKDDPKELDTEISDSISSSQERLNVPRPNSLQVGFIELYIYIYIYLQVGFIEKKNYIK